jgi:hypothetical protein
MALTDTHDTISVPRQVLEGAPVTDTVTQYKSLLGALMHIFNVTRQHVAFAASNLARFVNALATDNS